ncbi:TetR/AcrR family transcriptional regulator [Mycobacterium xenopi]|uniref:HTH tetR-type domain-containing protein n=1 Tax=Mycobacterium xenopi TaxID=1789 RepID=A0AAD1LZN7_MYCXE|nr:TetR/AcrR family transcriptional regulator [Mycobacterium xenopi]MDA3639682.1 TetR/AcrR family transcriptional regulator [Mycobacterium xenopi]MDA3657932.1 TetR/AcrR family transcriptional regulator [Mycobacterium xenopi]MDA3663551.1 TetR/AcrR family transcriptional regulator [Mycobacterium xenopi]ORX21188.1 TetR family transcriptional regulator [Mycobacterium xenopi]SPX78986.1 transcriptional regulator [Mycobacterium xenopi]
MSEASIVRRTSYGPSSPAVGVRGATTRTRITEVSLDLFGRLGFFDTSVDAIAKAAGVSRATLYQYFQGKDEIFLELLNECGSALFRVARRIGPLGPDDVGFDNLNWWLGEWSWVFDKYSTMFIQWTAVASSDTQVRPQITRFVRSYNHRIAERLAASGVCGIDPEVAAMTMTALVHRLNLFVHTGRAYGRSLQAVVDTLSVFLQLMLFPGTPPAVFSSLHLHASTDPAADLAAIEVPPEPGIDGLSISDRTATLSKRAVNTVNALAAAGAEQFRARGYRSTSVDDIVEAANVARGTFYKYFSDKQDLLTAVAAEIYSPAKTFAERIAHADPIDDESTLRRWLATYVDFYDRYSGCIDAWAEGTTDQPTVIAIGENGQVLMDLGVARMLTRRPGTFAFDPIISALIVRALVTRVPQAAADLPDPISRGAVVELLLTCIRRGFFGLAG